MMRYGGRHGPLLQDRPGGEVQDMTVGNYIDLLDPELYSQLSV
jgi:hypothetical protein